MGFWALLVVLAVLHFLFRLGFGFEERVPDLLTLSLLLAARTGGAGVGAGLGFLFGLLEDALSLLAFGANTVAMTVVGVVGAGTRAFFVGDSVLFVVGYLMAGKWLRDMIFWIVAGEAVREPFVRSVVVQGGAGALYVGLVGTLLVLLAGRAREVHP